MKIRYKLVSSFLLVTSITLCFSVFIIINEAEIIQINKQLSINNWRANRIRKLKELNLVSTNAIQSYLLTKNRLWELVYDKTLMGIDSLEENLLSYNCEYSIQIRDIIKIQDKLCGIELLIISKIREQKMNRAMKLFDEEYQELQADLKRRIESLVLMEQDQFSRRIKITGDRVEASQKTLAVTISAGFLAAVLLSLYLGIALAKPIEKLIIAVNQMAGGSYNIRVVISSRDEIGHLSHSFNNLANQLEATIGSLNQEITRRRTAEKTLRIGKLQLEEKIRERTSELNTSNINLKREIEDRKQIESQLLQAQKMESLGQMAGGIAHDFNTLIGAVIGYAQIIRKQIPQKSVCHSDIDGILHAGNRAKNLIKKIKDFSRPKTAGKSKVDIGAAINEALQLTRHAFPKGVRITKDINQAPMFITADPEQIHQVFANILINAADAMKDSGGELHLSTRRTAVDYLTVSPHKASPGTYLELSISDSGCGIKPHHISKIFDPFFTTKDVSHGTGLGLSIVHGIVKNCKGFIEVKSQPGKGTEFNLFFPEAF